MLRHTRATEWIRDDKLPVPTVSRLLGHTSIQTTTDIYVHLTAADMRADLEAARGRGGDGVGFHSYWALFHSYWTYFTVIGPDNNALLWQPRRNSLGTVWDLGVVGMGSDRRSTVNIVLTLSSSMQVPLKA
jgi:hypothetical protein